MQFAPHLFWHIARARGGAVEIARRVLACEIAPPLKGTVWPWFDRNNLGPQHEPAPPDPIPVDERADRKKVLATHNLTADHPVERAAGKQLIRALGHHAGGVNVLGFHPARLLLFQTLLDPSGELLGG